ncbi:MAG: hypothetical protein Q8L01_02380 [Candidatus Woesebacteria bacterium]|nr:hypothetical protein [Candidatus Woesebacteria bacterium]
MKINNINGTSQNNCKCGSWLEHWQKFSNQNPLRYCPVLNCLEKAELGAHVQKDSIFDRNWYIVPMCKVHNAERNKSLEISNSTDLVSANVSETCEKRYSRY